MKKDDLTILIVYKVKIGRRRIRSAKRLNLEVDLEEDNESSIFDCINTKKIGNR